MLLAKRTESISPIFVYWGFQPRQPSLAGFPRSRSAMDCSIGLRFGRCKKGQSEKVTLMLQRFQSSSLRRLNRGWTSIHKQRSVVRPGIPRPTLESQVERALQRSFPIRSGSGSAMMLELGGTSTQTRSIPRWNRNRAREVRCGAELRPGHFCWRWFTGAHAWITPLKLMEP